MDQLTPNEQEHIEGRDPATGELDSRYDGTVTYAKPLPMLRNQPPGEIEEFPLLAATRPAGLTIARDLDAAIAELLDDDQTTRTPDGILVNRDQRRPR